MFNGIVMFVVVVVAWAMTTSVCAAPSNSKSAASKQSGEACILFLGMKFYSLWFCFGVEAEIAA
jgi:hypothetical protein